MPEITTNSFLQVGPKKRKQNIDRWFVLSIIFMALGLILAFLALLLPNKF